MAVLRRQADIGCVVVVAMNSQTSLTQLNMCDQVLLLTAAGTMAFAGTPLQIESVMGTSDWSRVLAQVSADPVGAHRAFRARQQAVAPAAPPEVAAPWPPPVELSANRQIRLVIGRQATTALGQPHLLRLLGLAAVGVRGVDTVDSRQFRPGQAEPGQPPPA